MAIWDSVEKRSIYSHWCLERESKSAWCWVLYEAKNLDLWSPRYAVLMAKDERNKTRTILWSVNDRTTSSLEAIVRKTALQSTNEELQFQKTSDWQCNQYSNLRDLWRQKYYRTQRLSQCPRPDWPKWFRCLDIGSSAKVEPSQFQLDSLDPCRAW